MTHTPGGPDQPNDLGGGYTGPPVIVDLAADRRRSVRRWLPWFIGFDVLVVLVVVSVLGAQAGWFSGDSESAGGTVSTAQIPSAGKGGGPTQPSPGSGGSQLVASSARALTAAVVTHLPRGVTVVWSTGTGSLAEVVPGSPADMNGGVLSSMLLRSGGHEFYLSVVTTPGKDVPQIPTMVVPKRDKAGHLMSQTVLSSTDSASTIVLEIAGPGGADHLPLSEAVLRELVADPLVGPKTTRQMLERSNDLPGFTTSPPPIDWPHSPI